MYQITMQHISQLALCCHSNRTWIYISITGVPRFCYHTDNFLPPTVLVMIIVSANEGTTVGTPTCYHVYMAHPYGHIPAMK